MGCKEMYDVILSVIEDERKRTEEKITKARYRYQREVYANHLVAIGNLRSRLISIKDDIMRECLASQGILD